MLRFTQRGAGGLGLLARPCKAAGPDLGKQPGRLLERAALGQQNGGIVARLDRKAMLAIDGRQPACLGIELQRQLAAGEHLAIRIAQERRQHAATLRGVGRIPIDVEELGIRAGTAPLQHVQPPGVVGPAHAHVVGHDIEHEAHAVLPQGLDQPAQRVLATQLRIEAVMVHDIVAMGRPGARCQQWRGIEMTNAQPIEIRHQRRGVIKGETLVELQPCGGG